MSFKTASFSVLGFSFLVVGCGGKSNSASDAATTAASGTVSSDVASLKDLSLTGVLAISLPDSVKGTGTGAGLRLADVKSFEACKLRQELKEGLSNIAQVASTFCFLENDPNITFGKKYNIDFSAMMPEGGAGSSGGTADVPPSGDVGTTPPDGFDPSNPPAPPGLRLTQASGFPSTIQIWIDNATSDKLTVYFCEDKKLSQMIEVTGAKAGVAKGRVIMKQSISFGDFAMKFHRAMSFDNKFTDATATSITVKELIETTSTSFGTEKARRLLSLALPDTGVSKVLSSFSGSFQGSDNSFASIGAFDTDFGSVIAKGEATLPGSSEAIAFSNESYFDGKSLVVDADAYPAAFGANGKVKLKAENVPGFLGASFAPDEFPAGAWDCTGTTDLQLDATGSSGASCSEEWAELGDEDCSGAAFAPGEEVVIDESQQINPEEFESFAEEDIAAELRSK